MVDAPVILAVGGTIGLMERNARAKLLDQRRTAHARPIGNTPIPTRIARMDTHPRSAVRRAKVRPATKGPDLTSVSRMANPLVGQSDPRISA